jgi:hypothetical protein
VADKSMQASRLTWRMLFASLEEATDYIENGSLT